MSVSRGELAQRATGIWQNKWVRVAIQALLIVLFSGATAIAKRLHPSIGVPSSSAPFWLSIMVLARCTMNWEGAGTLVGVGTAVWGIPVHLEQSFTQNLASFAIAGLLLDIMLLIPKMNIRRWWGAVVCALVANLGQFGVIIYSSFAATFVKHFMVVGLLNSFGLHVAFGVASGLIGWAVFRGGQAGVRKITKHAA